MENPRLLDQVRDAIRVRHYSLRTEASYLQWIKQFILFHKKRHRLTRIAYLSGDTSIFLLLVLSFSGEAENPPASR